LEKDIAMSIKVLLASAFLYLIPFTAHAAVEPNYDPGKPPLSNPWIATQGEAERKADLGFIEGMKPHHEGALAMSEEYLKHKDARNTQLKQLAKGIIHNQKFEIGMLERVNQLVGKPLKLSADGTERRQVAEQGLAQKQRFVRAPMPGFMYKGDEFVSVRDVQFAKAMIVHHQGALEMAQHYLDNPAANNRYLRLLCVDILTDQKQEIDFMNKIIGKYKGNAAAIKPSAVHGMEGMSHHHAEAKPKPAPTAPVPEKPAMEFKGINTMDHNMMNHEGMGH
jgi:uncharacterized protein (DUF305 family)